MWVCVSACLPRCCSSSFLTTWEKCLHVRSVCSRAMSLWLQNKLVEKLNSSQKGLSTNHHRRPSRHGILVCFLHVHSTSVFCMCTTQLSVFCISVTNTVVVLVHTTQLFSCMSLHNTASADERVQEDGGQLPTSVHIAFHSAKKTWVKVGCHHIPFSFSSSSFSSSSAAASSSSASFSSATSSSLLSFTSSAAPSSFLFCFCFFLFLFLFLLLSSSFSSSSSSNSSPSSTVL